MTKKGLLFLSNGYGEDSFASILLERCIQFSEIHRVPSYFYIFPLVGEGAQFLNCLSRFPDKISLMIPPHSLPSGGVYLGSTYQKLSRLFSDCIHGVIPNSGYILRELRKIKDKVEAVIGVGDFIPPLINSIFLGKKLFMVACAHTFLLKRKDHPFERLGRLTGYLFRRRCQRVYTRDRLTERWFHQLGIPACYLGFLGPEMGKKLSLREKIVLLPGSRKDWKENLQFFIKALEIISPPRLMGYKLHFVFSPGLEDQEINRQLARIPRESQHTISWSRGDYFYHLSQAALVVGFAGTAIEQAAFLGIPSIEPWRESALQANRDFIENRQKLLLRDALLLGGDSPLQLAHALEDVLLNLPKHQKAAEDFSRMVWEGKSNAGMAIAEDIFLSLTT